MVYLASFKRSKENFSLKPESNPSVVAYCSDDELLLTAPMEKQKKCVRIMPSVTVFPLDQPPSSAVPREEKEKLYYAIEDINKFHVEVKEVARTRRKDPLFSTANACIDVDDSLRGMERHLCSERVQNMVLANRAVLKFQELNKIPGSSGVERELNDKRLALFSSKMSQWSKLIAMETGRVDALKAYGDDEDMMKGMSRVPIPITPFPKLKRRRVTVDEDSNPAKRRRHGYVEV